MRWLAVEHGTRRLVHVNVTSHPSADWTLQQLREVVGDADSHRYLIHDRDANMSAARAIRFLPRFQLSTLTTLDRR